MLRHQLQALLRAETSLCTSSAAISPVTSAAELSSLRTDAPPSASASAASPTAAAAASAAAAAVSAAGRPFPSGGRGRVPSSSSGGAFGAECSCFKAGFGSECSGIDSSTDNADGFDETGADADSDATDVGTVVDESVHSLGSRIAAAHARLAAGAAEGWIKLHEDGVVHESAGE